MLVKGAPDVPSLVGFCFMRNHMPVKCMVKILIHSQTLGMVKYVHHTLYNGCNYLSMLGLKLSHVCKRGARWITVCSISRNTVL